MITPLSEALAERGYDTLTPVQEAVIAPDLEGSDLLVSAQTGSGKTIGFGLAIAPTLLGEAEQFGPAAEPMALVVAPTRELAFQVKRELAWLYARTGAVVASCVGGMDMRQERRTLERGAHIVVGTPGRLRDHIERASLDLSGLRAAILDEADEMLDLGFREDLEFILGAAPEDRRTLLFSATVPPVIAKLAEQYQRDARRISTLSGTEQHADIAYQAIRVAGSDSEHAIFNLLRFHHDKGAIVFANTRAAVNHLTARLANRGFATVSLSGELSQSERTHALQAMRDGRARICVATDVAARGIDLPNLNLVIHADLPTNTESLLHRSGRTGRAGRKGISALIVPPKMAKKAERLLKWAKISAEWTVAPSAEDILRQDEERLLSDPAWDEALTEEESAFAEKLLARHAPEAIAAAFLRLDRARHSAPEELLPPDAKSEKRPDREFGPSRWFALSVGRADRAEARWLLPLLCRAGNLEKADIGAIRVQQSETFVEIAEAGAKGFLSALGDGGTLEDGVTARLLDSAPDLGPQSRGPKPDRGDRPQRGPRKDDRPREPRKPAPRRDEGERPAKSERPAPRTEPVAEVTQAPKPAPKREAPKKDRVEAKTSDHPRKKFAAPDTRKDGGKPKFDSKPKYAGKPKDAGKSKDGGKSKDDGKPKAFGKPKGKFGQKPEGKPKGAAPSGNARDTSKRFSPKGGAKAQGKPGKPRQKRDGGFDVPRRGKS